MTTTDLSVKAGELAMHKVSDEFMFVCHIDEQNVALVSRALPNGPSFEYMTMKVPVVELITPRQKILEDAALARFVMEQNETLKAPSKLMEFPKPN